MSVNERRLPNPSPVTPDRVSRWREVANTNAELVDAVYNSVESLFGKLDPVLEQTYDASSGGKDETVRKSESEVVDHLVVRNEKLQAILVMLDTLKDRLQV